MLKHALLYAQLGWAVFPLSPNSKIPYAGTHGCKDASKDPDKVTAMFTKYPDSNIGVATGSHSGFFVLDIDNKKDGSGEVALEELEAKYGKLPETIEQFTPSGGRHLLFKMPKGIRISNSTNNLGKYLDVRGDGGYIVVAPSSINGKDYCFEVSKEPFNFDMQSSSPWLFGLVQETKRDYDINLAEKDRLLKKGDRDERMFTISCVARNQGLKDQGSLFAYMQGVNINNCRPPLPDKDVMKIVNSCLSYEDKKAKADIKGEVIIWDKGKEGSFRTTYRNCLNFLNTEKDLMGLFKFNEFSNKTMLYRKPKWDKLWHGQRTLNDNDILQLKNELTTLNFQPSVSLLNEAVQTHALKNKFHPVREYLDGLIWDGVERVDNFLCEYFSAEDSKYTKFVSKLLLCAAVRRIMRPGCKYDYMIILEGSQGLGKSLAIEALGGEWASGVTLIERDKDLIDKMQGQWIIEVPELQVFKKKEIESLKNFLSTGVDRVRLSYARHTEEYPRQSIFIGTINPNGLGYFQDDTGNRRFLPVTCGKINWKGIAEVRDQLFAESYQTAKTDFGLYLPPDIDGDAVVQQEFRLAADEWDTYIRRWLDNPRLTSGNDLTIGDVWVHALNGKLDQIGRIEQVRISRVLKKFGYEQKHKRIEGKMARVFIKTTIAPAELQEAVWEEEEQCEV